MKQLLKNFGLAILLSSLLTMVIVSVIPVRAGGAGPVIYNTEIVILQEARISAESSIAGQNGYMIFNPGAIGYTTAISKNTGITPNLVSGTPYRRGSTDAFWNFEISPFPGVYKYFGGHTSSSDLTENQIWIDGFLKASSDAGWRTTCANHTSMKYAYCSTTFNSGVPRVAKAQSKHYYHKSGYIDNNFTTADQT